MSEPAASRIADLETELEQLKQILANERRQRNEERTRQNAREASLRTRLAERAKGPAQVPRVAIKHDAENSHKGSFRDVARVTPRTSTDLFAAIPSKSQLPVKKGSRSAPVKRSVTSGGASSPHHEKAATNGTPADVKEGQRRTALQHSWDKFCVIARDQFTPKQLALVSPETLQDLLDHYKITSAIERAQIEAQWALYQDGKTDVGATATPRAYPSGRRGPIRRAVHSNPFSLDGPYMQPHLSKRIALCKERCRPSNPNETTSHSSYRRLNSWNILRPRNAAPCNPNDLQAGEISWRPCFRRSNSESVPTRNPFSHGMMHVPPPSSGEYTPRGIRSKGCTAESNPFATTRPEGVRVGLGNFDHQESRRGVRTFDPVNSPTRVHRPTRRVDDPPHVMRSKLSTDILACGGQWKQRREYEPIERRTPFALDFSVRPATSANARAAQ